MSPRLGTHLMCEYVFMVKCMRVQEWERLIYDGIRREKDKNKKQRPSLKLHVEMHGGSIAIVSHVSLSDLCWVDFSLAHFFIIEIIRHNKHLSVM